MDEHYIGGPASFTRENLPLDFTRGPPPIGYNMPPPTNVLPPLIHEHHHSPTVNQDLSVYPPYPNSMMPPLQHSLPKKTFQGGAFSVNDFTQPPPAIAVPLYIPQDFEGHGNVSASASTSRMWQVHSQSLGQQIVGSSEDSQECDQKWIKGFEQKIQSQHIGPSKKKLSLQLSHVQDMMNHFKSLMQKLEDLKEEMKVKYANAEETLWDNYVNDVGDIKEKMANILGKFQDEEFITSVKSLISQRQNKRRRMKKQKERLRRKKEELRRAQQREEQKINVWREKLEEQEQEKRREKAVKLEADKILGEVRQKQAEALRMQQLLESLNALRKARLTKGISHGYISTVKDDQHFSSTIKAIDEVVASQMKEYHLEEQTLRVMMGENISSQSNEGNEISTSVGKREGALRKLVFGDASPINIETLKDYTAAEGSWEKLLQRRYEWDQYITEENTPLASAIPINWVVPPANPSNEWEQYKS